MKLTFQVGGPNEIFAWHYSLDDHEGNRNVHDEINSRFISIQLVKAKMIVIRTIEQIINPTVHSHIAAEDHHHTAEAGVEHRITGCPRLGRIDMVLIKHEVSGR